MNFGKMEEEYFCAEGWTGVIGLELLGKIVFLAQQWDGDLAATLRTIR
jgi:hypothetical protein